MLKKELNITKYDDPGLDKSSCIDFSLYAYYFIFGMIAFDDKVFWPEEKNI